MTKYKKRGIILYSCYPYAIKHLKALRCIVFVLFAHFFKTILLCLIFMAINNLNRIRSKSEKAKSGQLRTSQQNFHCIRSTQKNWRLIHRFCFVKSWKVQSHLRPANHMKRFQLDSGTVRNTMQGKLELQSYLIWWYMCGNLQYN